MSALSILGTSSGAGKSLVTTALARWFARRGVSVAPFKAQNMSNNARVVAGGEMGAAQFFQALAAGVPPDVRMNPVLVKPEGDDRSQVIVDGHVDHELSATPWSSRAPRLCDTVAAALSSLSKEFELLLIEGAGSPAEINLREADLANLRAMELAGASAVLVADVDRGGAFAHLFGTWALLEERDRRRIGGFVLNRFRGDRELLSPGPERLEELTGVPTIGVVPMLQHDLPDEDGAGPLEPPSDESPVVGVVRYPTASNLDELRMLAQVAHVRWLERADLAEDVDLLVLPGSKRVGADLAWLRRGGWPAALRRRAGTGRLILAICGGMQMLGLRLEDPQGVDGVGVDGRGVEGETDGLGLLPIVTTFRRDKLARPARIRFAQPPGAWGALAGMHVDAYEIRHGRVAIDARAEAIDDDELAVAAGSILGVTAHGLLENPEVLRRLFGRRPPRTLDRTFDELADAIDAHLDAERLLRLAER